LQKEPYKRDHILQKRLILLRRLLIVATPYVASVWHDSFMCGARPFHVYDSFICVVSVGWLWCGYFSCVCETWDSFICVAWLIHVCGMSHSCVTCLIYLCDMTHSYVWHDSVILIHVCHDSFMCAITHSCVRHVSFICDMTHLIVWHDSFICVTWLIYLCDMTHSCVRHVSFIWTHAYVSYGTFIRVTWLIHTCVMTHDSFISVPWLIHKCVTTHSYVWFDMCRNSQNQQLS